MNEVRLDVKDIAVSLSANYVTHIDLTDAANALRTEFTLSKGRVWMERLLSGTLVGGGVALISYYINHRG